MEIVDIKNSSVLSHAQSGEHYNLLKNIVGNTETDIAEVADAQLSYDKLKERTEREGVLFKLSADSEETVKITELNKLRISCWKFIIYTLDYYEGSRLEAQRTAAKHLNHVLKTYKGLTDLNLFAKTGYIRDAIDALKPAPEQASINLIPGLLPAVNELEAMNTELDGFYVKRAQDKGFVRGLGTLGEYRPKVDQALFDLVGDINSAYRRNKMGTKDPTLEAAIERVANTINSLYNQLRDILAHRHAIGKKNPQQPDIDNPEVPGEGGDDGNEGGDSGDGGETPGGGFENPDTENPGIPPFLPDFE